MKAEHDSTVADACPESANGTNAIKGVSHENLKISDACAIRGDASQMDLVNELDASVAQFEAQLAVITGEGFDTFSCLNDRIQAAYLWALSTQFDKIKASWERHQKLERLARSPVEVSHG